MEVKKGVFISAQEKKTVRNVIEYWNEKESFKEREKKKSYLNFPSLFMIVATYNVKVILAGLIDKFRESSNVQCSDGSACKNLLCWIFSTALKGFISNEKLKLARKMNKNTIFHSVSENVAEK